MEWTALPSLFQPWNPFSRVAYEMSIRSIRVPWKFTHSEYQLAEWNATLSEYFEGECELECPVFQKSVLKRCLALSNIGRRRRRIPPQINTMLSCISGHVQFVPSQNAIPVALEDFMEDKEFMEKPLKIKRTLKQEHGVKRKGCSPLEKKQKRQKGANTKYFKEKEADTMQHMLEYVDSFHGRVVDVPVSTIQFFECGKKAADAVKRKYLAMDALLQKSGQKTPLFFEQCVATLKFDFIHSDETSDLISARQPKVRKLQREEVDENVKRNYFENYHHDHYEQPNDFELMVQYGTSKQKWSELTHWPISDQSNNLLHCSILGPHAWRVWQLLFPLRRLSIFEKYGHIQPSSEMLALEAAYCFQNPSFVRAFETCCRELKCFEPF